uniref:IRG-type G domain-containing protein n=1 Tax=Sphenodon punctatus TaxID=8508 RepID=A0A8D0HKT7_SPHPU
GRGLLPSLLVFFALRRVGFPPGRQPESQATRAALAPPPGPEKRGAWGDSAPAAARNHDGDLEDLKPVSERKIKELYKICETGSLSEVPGVILSALDEPSQIQLDVAVLGEVGSGKSSLVNSLRGVCCGEPGAAPTGVTETARKAIAYAFPTIPNLYLWDLPGVGVTEEDVGHLDLSRYNFFLLVASERYKHTHSSLARAIIKAGKSLFFVRSKIDVDLETRPGSQPRPKEELQEQVRKICTEALKKDGVDSPRVFLVSSLDREAFDLPQLLEALQNDAPALKAAALEDAIPAVISRLVRRKSKVLLKDVWGKALQSCLYCMEKPEPDIATSLLTTIASFCIDLGLDEASLGRIAKDTSKPPALLQAEVRCPYTKPVAPEHVLKLITKPVTLYNQVWSYVPYWGRGELTKQLEISFPATYGLMKQVVCDLAEDAERMLLRAFAKD